eukprot:6446353-Pyramimonas_sp.AAC.1
MSMFLQVLHTALGAVFALLVVPGPACKGTIVPCFHMSCSLWHSDDSGRSGRICPAALAGAAIRMPSVTRPGPDCLRL